MREALHSVCPALFWVFAAIYAVAAVFFLVRFLRGRDIFYLLCALFIFGLFYDSFVLALGSFMPEGPALHALSRMRFVFHGVLIPLIIPVCAYALGFRGGWLKAAWIVTALLIALGAAYGFAVELTVERVAGIVRYTSVKETPAWISAASGLLSYGMVIPLIAAGIAVWIKQKTPLLFLAGFLMFAFSALGPATGNFDLIFLIGMFGELCMAVCYLLYARRRNKAKE